MTAQHRWVGSIAAAWLTGVAALAQFPPPTQGLEQWQWPTPDRELQPQPQTQRGSTDFQALTPRNQRFSYRNTVRGRNRQPERSVFREPQPFPTFPSTLPGIGSYPTVGMPPPFSGIDLLPEIGTAPPRDPNAWPSWIAADSDVRADEGFLPDRAILIRSADRVWYLPPDRAAYVPLPFYDKFRLVKAGGSVRIERSGEFWILFHGGATLRARGKVAMRVDELSEDVIAVQLEDHTRVWVTANERPVRISLDTGELVTLAGTRGLLERIPGEASVRNAGPGVLTVEGPAGDVEVPAAHRVDLLANMPPTVAADRELALDGDVSSVVEGRILRAEAGADGGAVVWNGARFAVPPRAVLRIDPLGGEAFPDNRPDLP